MHQILYNGNPIGYAEIHREGMFYHFICNCNIVDSGIYSVLVDDGMNRVNLGICIPVGNRYKCVTRIPCNRLTGERLVFLLTDSTKLKRIPVATGKSFLQLEKLKDAHLSFANGHPEIIINPLQGQQDSDQTREYRNKSELR